MSKKMYFFYGGLAIIVFLSYQIAFKHTFSAWQENISLKNRLNDDLKKTFQPAYLKRKNDQLDKILSNYQADTTAFRNNIVGRIAAIAEKMDVQVVNIPVQDKTESSSSFVIEKLIFRGSFKKLTRVLDTLCTVKHTGAIRSVTYLLRTQQKDDKQIKQLTAEVDFEISK